jgi:hypothetical protein
MSFLEIAYSTAKIFLFNVFKMTINCSCLFTSTLTFEPTVDHFLRLMCLLLLSSNDMVIVLTLI